MGLDDLGPTLLVVGALALTLPLLNRDTTAGRVVPCLICIYLLIRLSIWRLTSSLPEFDMTPHALWAYGFVTIETLATMSGILFLVFISRTRDRRRESAANQQWLQDLSPRVEVFIATYNEDSSILDRTILGAKAQDYANLRIWVLDDGRRAWLKELCDARGVNYLTRPDNAHAKAGNMNHALQHVERLADAGEFIAVLDADFVVQPDFVRKSMALFHDKKVGCVQTPQHFFNGDPIQHNFGCGNIWPDEQRFFFDVLLASKDAWGVAFSCGTSSICRIAAVNDIGGFPTESVTEDMLLSIKLRTRRWGTVYLNERLSMGLAPEGLEEYITQRGRWCLGFMQIFRQYGPFSFSRVPIIDRISMIDAFLYWCNSFVFRILCLLAPIVYMFTGAAIMEASVPDIFLYVVPTVVAQFIIFPWVSRGRCIPILSDVSQCLIATTALKATWIGLFGERNQKFKVTAKGGDRTKSVVQWSLMRPFLLLLAASVLGLSVYAFTPLNDATESWDYIWIFWTYYNIIVLTVACYTCIELPRSSDERFRSKEGGVVTYGAQRLAVRVVELWPGGAAIVGLPNARAGEQVEIEIEDLGGIPAMIASVRSNVAELAFSRDARLHDRMILKLFSGRYRFAPEKTDFSDVVRGISARLFA